MFSSGWMCPNADMLKTASYCPAAALVSKSRNTPYAGRTLPGRVVATVLRGRLTSREGAVLEAVPA